jgi:hypothetical protein
MGVRLRLPLTIAPAVTVAVLDLTIKKLVATQASDVHQRSPGWSLLMLVLLVVVLALVVLPSRLAAFAAGIVAGGIVGNVAWAVRHREVVANPIVVGGFAFNVADLFVLAGAPLLVVALARVAIKNREHIDRLVPPRRWEVAVRRRVGL